MKAESRCNVLGSIEMRCSCGAPLDLFVVLTGTMQKARQFAAGHIDCDRSPTIHGFTLMHVISMLTVNLRKWGRMPTREEYLGETDKRLITYDHEAAARGFYSMDRLLTTCRPGNVELAEGEDVSYVKGVGVVAENGQVYFSR